jgi:hypothetical protein
MTDEVSMALVETTDSTICLQQELEIELEEGVEQCEMVERNKR